MTSLNTVVALALAISPSLLALAGPKAAAASPTKSSSVKAKPAKSSVVKAKPSQPTKAAKATNAKAAGSSAKLTKIPEAKARATAVRPLKNPAGSAAMASLMQKFAEGGGSKFEKRVAQSMRRHGVSAAVAESLVKRLKSGSSIPSQANKSTLQAGVAQANTASILHLREAIALPPMNVPLP
ncbi:MAG: hypothetical protein AAGA56_30180, partial [Myxococcota bacterium]